MKNKLISLWKKLLNKDNNKSFITNSVLNNEFNENSCIYCLDNIYINDSLKFKNAIREESVISKEFIDNLYLIELNSRYYTITDNLPFNNFDYKLYDTKLELLNNIKYKDINDYINQIQKEYYNFDIIKLNNININDITNDYIRLLLNESFVDSSYTGELVFIENDFDKLKKLYLYKTTYYLQYNNITVEINLNDYNELINYTKDFYINKDENEIENLLKQIENEKD